MTPLHPFHSGFSRSMMLGSALAWLGLATVAVAEVPTGNLLVNGSGAAPLSTGWTVLANGGNGWLQSSSGGYDSTPG